MLSKSLLQFSVDGQSCVPSLLFDLRPNHGEGNEDNGDLLQKVLCRHRLTQCPQPCSRPPLTHGFTGDSWTPTDKSWIVSCGVTVPFSWVLVNRFCCALQESISQSCVSSGSFMVGLMVISYKRTYAIPTARAPVPAADHCRTSTGDAQTLFCLSLWHLWVLVCSRFA